MALGSRTDQLIRLAVGDVIYEEVEPGGQQNAMRCFAMPASRRPAALKDRVFKTSFYTAVHATRVGDIKYLVRVERTA